MAAELTAERTITLTDLVLLDGELYDSINALEAAWYNFCHGDETPVATQATPQVVDRIDRIHYDLRDYVARLQNLTKEIRARS